MDTSDDNDPVMPRVPSRHRRRVASLTVAFFLLCLTWAVSTPFFDGPDEMFHHNSTVRVARGLGWPRPYDAPLLGSTKQAAQEARASGIRLDPSIGRPEPSARSRLVDPGTFVDDGADRMVQHPPGYYLLTAAPLKLAGVGSIRWDHAALLMRTTSAAILAAALPFLIGTATRITGDTTAGLVGGTSLIGIPFLSNMGGYVSNDNLLVTAAAATLYGAARLATDPDPPRWLTPFTGLALGIALFTKGYALALVPVVLLLAVLGVRRRPPERRRAELGFAALIPLVALASGGWWWIRNLVLLGKIQPSRMTEFKRSDPAHAGYSFVGFLRDSIDRLQATFWGRGANPRIALPSTLTRVATLVLLGLVVAGIVSARRHRLTTAVLALAPALIASTFLVNAHRIYRVVLDERGGVRGVQGRYLYAGLTGVAVAIGWLVVSCLRRTRGRPLQPAAVAVLLVAPWLAALGGLAWVVTRSRMAARKVVVANDVHARLGLPLPWILASLVLALVTWVVASTAREASGPSRPGADPERAPGAPPT